MVDRSGRRDRPTSAGSDRYRLAMRVLITGAARAIGAATAAVLGEHGCEVVATARDPELLRTCPPHCASGST